MLCTSSAPHKLHVLALSSHRAAFRWAALLLSHTANVMHTQCATVAALTLLALNATTPLVIYSQSQSASSFQMAAGWREPSALEIIAQPQHAHVWEGFRNIDADREARLLQVGFSTDRVHCLVVWYTATVVTPSCCACCVCLLKRNSCLTCP